jgi:protease II
MAFRLSTSSQNTRGLKRDSNAKFAAPPHRRDVVMVRKAGKGKQFKVGMNSQNSSQNSSQASVQHQYRKSRLAYSSAMRHLDHAYKDGALSKIPQSMFQTKEQSTPSHSGYGKEI